MADEDLEYGLARAHKRGYGAAARSARCHSCGAMVHFAAVWTATACERKVRWRPAWDKRTDRFEDVLVCASRGLPAHLAARLQRFDTRALRPYDPAYLAGWRAEEYAVDLHAGWRRASAHMQAVQDRRCSRDVSGIPIASCM